MSSRSVQCILTALKHESAPIIDYFGLVRLKSFEFPVFKSDRMILLGIGVGKKNIKNRIINLLAKKKDHEIYQFFNIGIAGGNKENTEIGKCYLINKIFDEQDKIYYYPELPSEHPFEEMGIVTVKKEVTSTSSRYLELVDMEASEIFRICNALVPNQRHAYIKIVSDYMDLNKFALNKNKISTLIKNNMNTIDSYLQSYYFEHH